MRVTIGQVRRVAVIQLTDEFVTADWRRYRGAVERPDRTADVLILKVEEAVQKLVNEINREIDEISMLAAKRGRS